LYHIKRRLSSTNKFKSRKGSYIIESSIDSKAFQNIVAFAEKNNIDMVLETEHDKVVEDIELLKKSRDS